MVSLTLKINLPLSRFAPDLFFSRHGLDRPVQRPQHYHSPHAQDEFGAYSWDPSRFPRRGRFVNYKIPALKCYQIYIHQDAFLWCKLFFALLIESAPRQPHAEAKSLCVFFLLLYLLVYVFEDIASFLCGEYVVRFPFEIVFFDLATTG